MGVDASRVKMALQRRVLQSRPMYANVNELLDAAFREQREQVGKTGLIDIVTQYLKSGILRSIDIYTQNIHS